MRSFVLVVAACGSTPPPSPPIPAACNVPVLPLLAKQHTPNPSRLYLAPITVAGPKLSIGTPELATTKTGYVNQPAFAGTTLYFTWRPDGGQSDVYAKDLIANTERAITCTSEEEYAPAIVGDRVTVVHVQSDLTTGLATLDGKRLFPAIDKVGSQVWIDANTVVMFTSGEPTALVRGDLATGATQSLVTNVGPALAVIPGTKSISYIDPEHGQLMKLDVATGATTAIMALPDDIQQVAWLDGDSLIAGQGTKLVRARAGDDTWHEVIDLGIGVIQRVVVSPDHTRIAVVAKPAQ
ncbi:MAG: hypothetical protein QM831_03065 [Kofleriaceae bacterium]